jgi:acetyltransferase
MLNKELFEPRSIVIVGGSNDVTKPGGKVLKNILEGDYKGDLYVLNMKERRVQDIESFPDPSLLPDVDLAIIAIPAPFIYEVVKVLVEKKNTRAFIIITAGFGESGPEGKLAEARLTALLDSHGATLIGPNCIGVLTPHYHGIFTKPIPKLDRRGCDFISGSGATACFIMEAGIPKGLTFAHVISVGNSAQQGVEEVLQHLDESFDPEKSSRIKLLYIETINKPSLLLKHASSLVRKGCYIAAIKAGTSDAGSRAALSHTGAIAGPDFAIDTLFRKAGIVRCYSREDLVAIAGVMNHPMPKGKRFAIITHAGGPAVMMTDTLSDGGFEVPLLEGEAVRRLKQKLFPGSSVANPIDFLATGTAEQLGIILDAVNNDFDNIDASVVIFGTTGLAKIFDAYRVLDEKMDLSGKPIYPVLPSILSAQEEIMDFLSRGRINFPDGVVLGRALITVSKTRKPVSFTGYPFALDRDRIRKIIESAEEGYLPPGKIAGLFTAAGIPVISEAVVTTREQLDEQLKITGFPVVMKVVGPLHKSEVGGVVLNVDTPEKAVKAFDRLLGISDATGVLVQPMVSGTELFIGAKKAEKFDPIVLFGLGGIFVEVLRDIKSCMVPVSSEEALNMIRQIKGYPIIKGIRGKEGVDEDRLAEIIQRISALVEIAPEIAEMDLNPLIGRGKKILVVDSRVRIKK